MAGVLVWALVPVGATAVIWQGSSFFECAAANLSKHYGLPVAVHGAIVVVLEAVQGI